MAKRSITDEEIGLIKAMLARGMANKAIQFYFNRQDRAVNSGRISGIKHADYGPEVPTASDEALSAFIANFTSPELAAPGIDVEIMVEAAIVSKARKAAKATRPAKKSAKKSAKPAKKAKKAKRK